MKVRVPKEHRPPTRFGIVEGGAGGKYRVTGKYRRPKPGEHYWSRWFCFGVCYSNGDEDGPRVILEKVKE
jgi:hypothetical protein